MKATKFIIMCSCLLISIASMAQTLFYGARTELTVNDPTYTDEDTKIVNSPVFKIGVLGGAKKDNIDLGFEMCLLLGFERLTWEDKYEGAWYRTQDASNMFLEIPITLKKGFAIPGSPVKPLLSAGIYVKTLASENKGEREVDPELNETGINAGLGVTLFSSVELGVIYRYILSENTWGAGRWLDPRNQQKNQIIISAALVLNK